MKNNYWKSILFHVLFWLTGVISLFLFIGLIVGLIEPNETAMAIFFGVLSLGFGYLAFIFGRSYRRLNVDYKCEKIEQELSEETLRINNDIVAMSSKKPSGNIFLDGVHDNRIKQARKRLLYIQLQIEQKQCQLKNTLLRKKQQVDIDTLQEDFYKLHNMLSYEGYFNPSDELSPEQMKLYEEMVNSFMELSDSKVSRRVIEKSANSSGKTPAKIAIETIDDCPICDNYSFVFQEPKPPVLHTNDGGIVYLYPSYIVVALANSVTITDSYSALGLIFEQSRFYLKYRERVPEDAEVVGKYYPHTTKDGERDCRYRIEENPEIPIVLFGELRSEKYKIHYQFSNAKSVEAFHAALTSYLNANLINEYALQAPSVGTQVTEPSQPKEEVKEASNPSISYKLDKTSQKDDEKKVIPTLTVNPFDELSSLIGLEEVKDEISSLISIIKVQQTRAAQGLKNPQISYHCVFTGNPGTGKTTVARIIAGIYKKLGILKIGHLVETDRSGLVAEYLGQTAVKTNELIDSALDGVLFIDEAYSLSDDNDSYGKEAIATLLKRMEDDRSRLVVILAGYTENMKTFISSNPGLESRFNRYIQFSDYSIEELKEIFVSLAKKNDYAVSELALGSLEALISKAYVAKGENFGNARFVRNIFEKAIANQAGRLSWIQSVSHTDLITILPEDIKNIQYEKYC